METFLNSVQSVTEILLLMAVGYFCAAKGWFTKEAKLFISRLLMNIAIPFMCVYSMRTRMTLELLQSAGKMLLIPTLTSAFCFLLALPVGKLLKLPRRTLGVFLMLCGLPNSLFIGYPMTVGIFGESASPYVMIYYIICAFFTQLVGQTLVRWAGQSEMKSAGALFLNVLKTPVVWGIIGGALLVVLNIQPPAIVMSFAKYMNNITTPLAVFVSGEVLYGIGFKNMKPSKEVVSVLLFRFLVSPGLCILACRAFGIADFPKAVFMIMAAMPCVSQTVVMASNYGADEEMACQGIAWSTLASFAAIPVLTLLVS